MASSGVGSLYDDVALKNVRYPDNVRWNYENLILNKLTFG